MALCFDKALNQWNGQLVAKVQPPGTVSATTSKRWTAGLRRTQGITLISFDVSELMTTGDKTPECFMHHGLLDGKSRGRRRRKITTLHYSQMGLTSPTICLRVPTDTTPDSSIISRQSSIQSLTSAPHVLDCYVRHPDYLSFGRARANFAIVMSGLSSPRRSLLACVQWYSIYLSKWCQVRLIWLN